MSLTRRRFTQILASTLFLHHLPSFAQSVKFWASRTLPEAQNITRIVSAGAPADLLLLAVAPEKMVGFSSFDFARQALDRKSTRLNSSHSAKSRMPSSA